MVSLFEQAQAAVQQQNWSAVGQIIEQWLNREPASDGDAVDPDAAGPPDLVLDWAIQVLTWGDFQARWDIAKVLPSFGELAIAPLIDLLHNDGSEIQARWYAARILGGFAHPNAIQALIIAVQADDDDLSRMAATALANLGTGAITALTPLLTAPGTRSLAVSALAQIRHSATIAPLLSVTQDADAGIRTLAIEALGSFHDARVPQVLVQALHDPAAGVRRAAISGLGFRTDLGEALDLVQQVGDRLWDLDLTVCQQAAIALGRFGTPAAVARLCQILQSPHAPLSLQRDAIRAIAWTGQATALHVFHTLLCPPPEPVSEPVSESVPAPASESIAEAVPSPPPMSQGCAPLPPDLRLDLIRALGQWSTPDLKPRAAEILIHALDHSAQLTGDQQQAIALALGELGQPAALDPLIGLLATANFRLCLHIIAALKRLDAPLAHARLIDLAAAEPVPIASNSGIAIALQEW